MKKIIYILHIPTDKCHEENNNIQKNIAFLKWLNEKKTILKGFGEPNIVLDHKSNINRAH